MYSTHPVRIHISFNDEITTAQGRLPQLQSSIKIPYLLLAAISAAECAKWLGGSWAAALSALSPVAADSRRISASCYRKKIGLIDIHPETQPVSSEAHFLVYLKKNNSLIQNLIRLYRSAETQGSIRQLSTIFLTFRSSLAHLSESVGVHALAVVDDRDARRGRERNRCDRRRCSCSHYSQLLVMDVDGGLQINQSIYSVNAKNG